MFWRAAGEGCVSGGGKKEGPRSMTKKKKPHPDRASAVKTEKALPSEKGARCASLLQKRKGKKHSRKEKNRPGEEGQKEKEVRPFFSFNSSFSGH